MIKAFKFLNKYSVVKIEKYDTNNEWGFGGAIGVKTYYNNGLVYNRGSYCYRHMKPSSYNNVLFKVSNYEHLFNIHGKVIEGNSIYRCNKVNNPNSIEKIRVLFPVIVSAADEIECEEIFNKAISTQKEYYSLDSIIKLIDL